MFSNALWLLTTAFWVLMIIDCMSKEPERRTWIWILILLNYIGALVYFILRYLPRSNLALPRFLGRWTRRQELWNAEAEAKNIGKDHQFVRLGNILFEIGEGDRARTSYYQALEKNPQNLQALWGAASIEVEKKNLEAACKHLEALLALDPEYKFGEADLLYSRVLYMLQDLGRARDRLEQNARTWGNAEARLLLAEIYLQDGNNEGARQQLDKMLNGLRGSPRFHYQNNRHLVRKAERLLKKCS